MSSGSYGLESFRPWNPFQDKTQPHRDSLDIHRYLSPVSITTTSPPSNSNDPASRSPKVHSHKPERHPLPTRPPVEVCLNDSLPQETNTMHLPSAEDQACINSGTEAFAFEDILQLQDLPSSGDGEYSMSGGDLGLESQYLFSCESGDRELAFTSGQHS
ncbi:hypothetical protein N7486_003979 [Penicillium sp. IBT 16267x]|nr:hypothetical protein N7486_003979 [Penicillium sp. IBT 16267x]